MINYLSGTIKNSREKEVILSVGGLGFAVQTPQANRYTKDKHYKFFAYLHWNQEKGPSLFGFQTELERTVFLLIMQCPKIGPSIALSTLHALSAEKFLEAVTSQNITILSAVSGIGKKKAEHIIVNLKHKVSDLIAQGDIKSEEKQSFIQWQQVSQVLTSLNYSRAEIDKVLQFLTKNHADCDKSLDQLIRISLSFLSMNK